MQPLGQNSNNRNIATGYRVALFKKIWKEWEDAMIVKTFPLGQSVTCSVCKREGLSLDLQHPRKKTGRSVCVCVCVCVEPLVGLWGDRQILGVCWPSLAELTCSRFRESLVSKNKGEHLTRRWPAYAHRSTYPHVHKWAHANTNYTHIHNNTLILTFTKTLLKYESISFQYCLLSMRIIYHLKPVPWSSCNTVAVFCFPLNI